LILSTGFKKRSAMDRGKITEKSTKNRFTSGEQLSGKEFKQGIEQAEKGPFYSVQESMNRFEEWLTKRKKR
jgi:predicted transcriptional regulator